MAEATSKTDESTLSSLFKEIWDAYLYMEHQEDPTGSDKVQGEVRKILAKAEQAIYMVNQLQLFSDNEEIDEVASNEIKYMLLPALLAYFHNLNTHASRLETVQKAKTHYRDFLRMCKSYKVSAIHIPVDADDHDDDEEEEPHDSKPANKPGAMDLQATAVQRQSKIERFRQSKVYESRLKELSEAVEKDSVDEEVKREFYLTQVKRWINTALDELESLDSEVQILKHMAQMKKQGAKSHSSGQASGEGQAQKPKTKPFRPFILTKDLVQKQVFGLGYPSIPTMSIEEFYQQKVNDGTFSIPQCGQGG
ncbi:hypothetical protein BaRGS_00031529 [Batillaria attramentaria]|uniref:Uncharacterized protein n=1 Tax=Batillaria attramentaria TaxID=370345 RepID=A0ABD0JQ74_9CAEN